MGVLINIITYFLFYNLPYNLCMDLVWSIEVCNKHHTPPWYLYIHMYVPKAENRFTFFIAEHYQRPQFSNRKQIFKFYMY